MASIKMPKKPKMPKMPKGNSEAALKAYIQKLDAIDAAYRKSVADTRKAIAAKVAERKRVESLKKTAASKRASFCKVK